MPLYDPNTIPPQAEIDAVALKIEALRGVPIAPADKAAIAGMTRGQITDYIKALIK